nr:reverse transcriptase domain-containing protein [Tanacetum cinerariifolium]
DDKLLVIIAKDLSVEEKTALIIVLKSHKRAIAWKLSDIKGINLEFYTDKILMEEDFKPAIQHQRRVNLKIHDVIKQEEFTSKVIDTKGAENLAVDHLSRLENPQQNMLDPKEINESFPLKTLNLVSTRGNQSTSWLANFTNYHAGNYIVKGMSSQQKSVYQARKLFESSRLAIMDPQETSGQVEVSNHGLKRILESAVGENRAS